MIASGNTLERLGVVTPFCQRTVFKGMSFGKSYAGYDIRIAQAVKLGRESPRFSLASSVEKFVTPRSLVGVVHDKSTWARRGLSVFNTVIEPGWEGYLTLELVYHGDDCLDIEAGSPIAQVMYHFVDEEGSYNGKYQHQPDRPVEAIEESGKQYIPFILRG